VVADRDAMLRGATQHTAVEVNLCRSAAPTSRST
jgi:hypothetical protein